MKMRCAAAFLGGALLLAAHVSGRWNFKAVSPDGEDPATLALTQEGEKLTGFVEGVRGKHKLEGVVKGGGIRFAVHYAGPEGTFAVPFEGRIDGQRMSGQFKAGEVAGAWSAERY